MSSKVKIYLQSVVNRTARRLGFDPFVWIGAPVMWRSKGESLDHILPLKLATCQDDFELLWRPENLRIIWTGMNRAKGAQVIFPGALVKAYGGAVPLWVLGVLERSKPYGDKTREYIGQLVSAALFPNFAYV